MDVLGIEHVDVITAEAASKRRRRRQRRRVGCSHSRGRRRNVAVDLGMAEHIRICNGTTHPHKITMTYQRVSLRHDIPEGVARRGGRFGWGRILNRPSVSKSAVDQQYFLGILQFSIRAYVRIYADVIGSILLFFNRRQKRTLLLGCQETTGRTFRPILPLKGDDPSQWRGGGKKKTRTLPSQYLDLR